MPMDVPSESFLSPVSVPEAALKAAERLGARRVFSDRTPELEERAKEFEGILLQQVFKQMKEATESLEVHDEEDGEDAHFGEQIQSMFWMFLGEQISREGGVGLWKEMVNQWTRENSSGNAAAAAGLDEQG